MHRLIAGAGLLVLVLTGCGNRTPEGPPPHIVALGVTVTTAAAPTVVINPVPIAVAQRASRDQVVRVSTVAAPPLNLSDASVWDRLARCESGGNPRAVGGGGRFFGAFQFTLSSWQAVGMSGNPIDYSYADQMAAAQRLQARSGWQNWPVCARRALGR